MVLELDAREAPPVTKKRGNRILLVPGGDVAPTNELVYEDGQPTSTLLRLLAAMRLWESGLYDFILVSGGRTHRPSIETRSVSDTMARWLCYQKNVPLGVILAENKSRDTFQNVSFSLERLKEEGVEDPKIKTVTHRRQNRRFIPTFRAYGIEIETHDVPYSIGVLGELKELVFYLVHLIDPKGKGPIARLNRWLRRRAATGT